MRRFPQNFQMMLTRLIILTAFRRHPFFQMSKYPDYSKYAHRVGHHVT